MNADKTHLWDSIPKFETLLNQLKSSFDHDQIIYNSKHHSITSLVKQHFNKKEKKYYGVYVFRKKEDSEVLYIGKAGTYTPKTNMYKDQDLKGRLTNMSGRIRREQWVKNMFDEHGALVVEYILFPDINMTPAFVESLMLQSYLKNTGTLPKYNKTF